MGKKITVTGASCREESKDVSREIITARFTGGEEMEASDGYHTFSELYDHRITLFMALCKNLHELLGMENPEKYLVWRSKRHSDGELCFGDGKWFVMGIGTGKGKQITYHLPIEKWGETSFATVMGEAPEWDGHSSKDVIDRLKKL